MTTKEFTSSESSSSWWPIPSSSPSVQSQSPSLQHPLGPLIHRGSQTSCLFHHHCHHLLAHRSISTVRSSVVYLLKGISISLPSVPRIPAVERDFMRLIRFNNLDYVFSTLLLSTNQNFTIEVMATLLIDYRTFHASVGLMISMMLPSLLTHR